MNEYVGYSEPDKQYDAQLVFSISLYMYHSYIFFILKESTTVTTDKQRARRIQQKNMYRNTGDESLPTVSD